MNLIYKIPNQQKIEVMNVIESDKYGEISFAKLGYLIKDGEQYGIEKCTLIVLRNVSEAFVKYSDEKLKNINFEKLDGKKTNEIISEIIEEEERAQSGLGAIFG